MKYLKLFETFKVKNITEEDIRNCIKGGGYVYSTILKDFPDNDPEEPLKPVSIDDDGLVTVSYNGTEYETNLKNIEKADIPKVNELKSSTYRSAAEKLKSISHEKRGKDLEAWINDRNYHKYGDFNLYGLSKDASEMFCQKITDFKFTVHGSENSKLVMVQLVVKFGGNAGKLRIMMNVGLDQKYDEGKISVIAPQSYLFDDDNKTVLFQDKKSAFKFKQLLSNIDKFQIEVNGEDELLFNVVKDRLAQIMDIDLLEVKEIFNRFKNLKMNALCYLKHDRSSRMKFDSETVYRNINEYINTK